MSVYLESIHSAIYLFPLVVLLVSLPLFIVVYRRRGSFPVSRGILLYSMVFYLLCAYFLVILPLPSREEVARYTQPYYNLDPLAFVRAFLEKSGFILSDPSTYLPALTSSTFLEPAFNIVLTIPFGFYLRYYFGLPLWKTLFFTLLLSLFFELTQLSGLYFIYPRPYRIADVDDLITNTFGGFLGYGAGALLHRLFPLSTLSEDQKKSERSVSFMRRASAFLVDWMIISVVQGVLGLIFGDIAETPISESVKIVLTAFLYFVLLQYFCKGQTPGKRLLRIRVVSQEGGRPKLFQLIRRYLPVYAFWGLLVFLTGEFPLLVQGSDLPAWGIAALAIFCIVMAAGVFILMLYYFITRKPRYIHERWSGTHTISVK